MTNHVKIKQLEEMAQGIPKNMMLMKIQLANHDLRGAGPLEVPEENFEHDILLLTKRQLELQNELAAAKRYAEEVKLLSGIDRLQEAQ